MPDTPHKVRDLPKFPLPKGPAARLTSYPSPLLGGAWRSALQGADHLPAGYRTVISQHTGGAYEWMVLSSSPSLASQTYPEPDVWRTVAVTKSTLAPGCALALRVVAVRSGLMQRFATIDASTGWHSYGPYGRLRVTIDYRNEAGQTAQEVVTVPLVGSEEANGAELTTAAWSWTNLVRAYVQLIHPEKTGTASELAKWSENTEITVTVQHEGGSRVVHCSLVEIPYTHAAAHGEETEVSIHGWPSTLPPGDRPQVEWADGATYEEHRGGVARGFAAAAKASAELGPLIASWTSYGEDVAEVQDTDPDQAITTSSSWRSIAFGTSVTSWSADNPGADLPGHYAQRAPECVSTRLDGAAAIPVRCRALVRWSTSGSGLGYLRFQSTERSWVELEVNRSTIGNTWTWVEWTGWLECSVAPDDSRPVLHDFWRRTAGNFECRYWAVHYDGRDASW